MSNVVQHGSEHIDRQLSRAKNMSPLAWAEHQLGNLRKHWEAEFQHRREIVRKNVELLTAKPSADNHKHSEPDKQRIGAFISSERVAPIPASTNNGVSTSVAREVGASAPDHLKLQVMQLLSSPVSFTDEQKERLLEELLAFLSSSSSSTVDKRGVPPLNASSAVVGRGESQNLEPAASFGAAEVQSARSLSPFSSMPLHPHNTPQHPERPVQSDAATHSSFEVGMLLEHSILELEDEVKRGNRRDLVSGELGEVSPHSTGGETPELTLSVAPVPRPLVDIEDVRKFVRATSQVLGVVRRFGLPESSMDNKFPWRKPPPPFLARGLEWPPDHFASEQDRIEFNRRARKRKKFLLGSGGLPTWSFMVANIALLAVLVYNPRAR